MKMQDFIVPFALAILTSWVFQYFFFGKKDVEQYKFSAPQTALECQPLNTEVTFTQAKRSMTPVITTVETQWGAMVFTTDGAMISRLEFKRAMNGKERILDTIYPLENPYENKAMLVALQDQTPFEYSLQSHTQDDEVVKLVYEARGTQAVIFKTFTVYKNIRKLDLALTIHPHGAVTPRIFYPAPILPELGDHDMVAADIIDGSAKFSKIARDAVKVEDGWVMPAVFGLENKYFIHAMIKDEQNFAQRAYFKTGGLQKLSAILEGPTITQDTTWNFSFYMGPKEVASMDPVDSRLEQAMDYSGMWAPISRVLLMILNWLFSFVHNYGVAILLLTFLIRLVLMPFSLKAERSMKGRVEMQKRLAYIQQKYKNDPQARAQAQADFMRENGLGLGGCLPLLMQIPIFFGLSKVLSSAIELYQAPFLWMGDLSAPDPYYILPVCVMLSMLVSAFGGTDDKQRLPIIGMALMFGAFSASMSAGLVLYIAFSTIVNVLQNRMFKLFRLV